MTFLHRATGFHGEYWCLQKFFASSLLLVLAYSGSLCAAAARAVRCTAQIGRLRVL